MPTTRTPTKRWQKTAATNAEVIEEIRAEAQRLGALRQAKRAQLQEVQDELSDFLVLARDTGLVEATQLAEWAGVARSRIYQVQK